MTPTQNTNAVSLRTTSDARKLELLSKHLGVNLGDVIAEETLKEEAEHLAELKRQDEELQKELVRKLKAQRDYVRGGLLSGMILAITPKRKLWSGDVTLLTDADCYRIKEACSNVRNMKSFPVFAQEIHITVEDMDLLVICRKSA